MTIDMNQGITKDGRTFGYVHGDNGGYFFTWMPTLEDTLLTVDVDQVDGDGGLFSHDVQSFLRSKLASKFETAADWSPSDIWPMACESHRS